jgi:hypothetical protein
MSGQGFKVRGICLQFVLSTQTFKVKTVICAPRHITMRRPLMTCTVKQVTPASGSGTKNEAVSGKMKRAWASLFTQNSHCSETIFSTPVIGITAVDAERSNVLVGGAEKDPVGRIVPIGGGVATGKLQLDIINANAQNKSVRELFIP